MASYPLKPFPRSPAGRFLCFPCLLALNLALLFLPSAHLAAESLRIVQLEPTVLFPRAEPLSQVAHLSVFNPGPETVTAELVVTIDGHPSGSALPLELPSGLSRHDALIPDLSEEKDVTIEIRQNESPLARHTQRWRPQRKWKVFIVKSSHEDIGYEDFLWKKQKEIADFIDLGRRLSTPGPAAGDTSERAIGGFRYWMESLLFTRYYAEERSEVALRELIENAVKPGILPMSGTPNGLHAHWMDYEELARTTYPGRRAYKDRFGLDLDTFAIVDNPSFSWASCQVLAQAGFKYAVRFGQWWRTGKNNDYKTTRVPSVFWWQAPDGKSRLLYAWRPHYGLSFWFGQTDKVYADLTELGAINVQRELSAIESGEKLGPYPWNSLLVSSYQDHETPAWNNRALRQWRDKYRYPDIRVGDPRDFMVEMEKDHGDQLPVLSGDLNNFSADYATIDPDSQGRKRRAARLLPLAEGLATAASLRQPTFILPPAEVDHAYQRLHDYDEHSWPTKPPARDVHQFNAQWGKLLEGDRALADAERLFDRSLSALAAQVATGRDRELMVVNPLAHPRSDLVFTTEPVDQVFDDKTGQWLPVQTLANGQRVFVASDIPAFGYRTFRLPAQPGPSAPSSGLSAQGNRIENEFYTITFDPASGAVTSIRDRELNRELIDPEAPYQFNQLVWVSKKTGESIEGKMYAPRTGAKLVTKTGPVAAEMIATLEDKTLGGAVLTQTVRIYTGVKRIDVINELRHVGVLSSPRSSDRYKENIFYAFPLKVDHFTHRAEYAGGVVRPYDDQLRWGSHDYLCANRWVDVSNADHGVTMAVHNAPIVHFGEIRYNAFSVDYKPSSSHLYGYVWSNRMDGLATLCPDDMNARVEYSFTSHAGDWNSGAASRLGWTVASPLVTRILPANQKGLSADKSSSFLAVDSPHVQVTVLKESAAPGRGWIVRLVETAGRPTVVHLDASRFSPVEAVLCDMVENDGEALPLNAGKIRLSIAPFSFATVRIKGATPATGHVDGLRVEASADDRVRLHWNATPGASHYHVFRSVDPDEPPTAYSLVGRVKDTGFLDTGLNLDTAYHYYVAAVSPGNQQGALSAKLTTRTGNKNVSPPSVVPELGIVRQAPNRLMVCWRKSPESDVARYFVYRDTQPNFDLERSKPIAQVAPSGFYLEHYVDETVAAGRTYYYQVVAEDWASNRQTRSPVAAGTPPKNSL